MPSPFSTSSGQTALYVSLFSLALGLIGQIVSLISLHNSRLSAIEGNRAWVGAVLQDISYSNGELIYTIQVANFGKGPALNVRVDGKWMEEISFYGFTQAPAYVASNGQSQADFMRADCEDSVAWIRNSILFPLPLENKNNPKVDVHVEINKSIKSLKSENLNEGETIIHVTGCVRYTTMGTQHINPYCYTIMNHSWEWGANNCSTNIQPD